MGPGRQLTRVRSGTASRTTRRRRCRVRDGQRGPSHGWDDYASWADDRNILKRINRLIEEAVRDPASGTGKPERLSGDLSGFWSRRIDREHRLVHTLDGDTLVVVQARYHY